MSADPELKILHEQAEILAPSLEALLALDQAVDALTDWSEELWQAVVQSGAPLWSLPEEYDGQNLSRPVVVARNALIAQSSLTAAFVLSQHDAANRRFLATLDRPRSLEWLRIIGQGKAFGTVGISQLTTSRRKGSQALVATPIEDGSGRFRLDGAMPWVTAAERADVIVTGALLDDRRQILAALPTNRRGLTVKPAFQLAALEASRTTEVQLVDVVVEPEEILAGPVADVMAGTSPVGTGGLETSALALGQARAALLGLEQEAPARPDLEDSLDSLRESWNVLWSDLIRHASGYPEAPAASAIRSRANALVLRATQAYLTARRGSGFLRSDPAQRRARQSLFFLVWSCPSPVASATVRDLVGLCALD